MSDALLQLAHGALAPASVDRLLDRHGGPDRTVAAICSGRAKVSDVAREAVSVSAQERRVALESSGVGWAVPGMAGYPERLGGVGGAPRWLFGRGETHSRPSIAIVGTRTCTAYGVELARSYGEAAVHAGWCVVSGMARGIDTAGHEGALDAGGHTIAVLGSGIDVVYPRSNRNLHDRILDSGGAVVSEYPPGTRPDGWRFPTRNRIIVGLADVVLVVEAGEGGGALITAGIAVEQSVPVYATPADVDRPASVGTNRLIRDGAFPVFDADDLGVVLSLVTPLVAR